LIKFTVV